MKPAGSGPTVPGIMQTHSKWQSLSQGTYIWPLYSSFYCILSLVTKKCLQWHQCNADLVLPYKFNLRKFLKVNPILTLKMWGSHRCEVHACSYMTKLRKKENPHQTCLCYTPGVDSMSSYSVSVTYTISGHITSFCRGGDNTNIRYRQLLLLLSWQEHAQVVLTEPLSFSQEPTLPRGVWLQLLEFFSFLHWCSVIYGYQQSGLELPVSFLCLCELTE